MLARPSCSQSGIDGIACLAQAQRVWAVAAIHGSMARLRSLHDQLDTALRPGDRLIYLGNYMGGGTDEDEASRSGPTDDEPDVHGTLDALVEFRTALLAGGRLQPCDIVHLRGRQEAIWDRLMQLQFADHPDQVLAWMVDQGVTATLGAYGTDAGTGLAAAANGPVTLARWTNGLRARQAAAAGHGALLGSLRSAATTNDRGILFVHSGLAPDRELSDQADLFWWSSLPALRAAYEGFSTVVCGLARDHPGLATTEFSAVLDGGCGFGGTLLAACFDPAGRIVDLLEG